MILDAFPATTVNTIMQVGHNTLRLMTIGVAVASGQHTGALPGRVLRRRAGGIA